MSAFMVVLYQGPTVHIVKSRIRFYILWWWSKSNNIANCRKCRRKNYNRGSSQKSYCSPWCLHLFSLKDIWKQEQLMTQPALTQKYVRGTVTILVNKLVSAEKPKQTKKNTWYEKFYFAAFLDLDSSALSEVNHHSTQKSFVDSSYYGCKSWQHSFSFKLWDLWLGKNRIYTK